MPEPTTNNDVTASGRDANGKFQPGNTAARRCSPAERTVRLRRSLLQAVTPADVKRIVRRLCERAMVDGDVQAAKLLLSFCVGSPNGFRKSIEADSPPPAVGGSDTERLQKRIGALKKLAERN